MKSVGEENMGVYGEWMCAPGVYVCDVCVGNGRGSVRVGCVFGSTHAFLSCTRGYMGVSHVSVWRKEALTCVAVCVHVSGGV